MKQIKELLAQFFAHRFTERVAKSAEANGITDENLDKWLNESTLPLKLESKSKDKPHFLADVIGIMDDESGEELERIVSREF